MKKLLLALLAVASVGAANAQKGTWLTYGNVGVSTDNTSDNGALTKTKNLSWNINPGIGYQFGKHWTVGVQGGYASVQQEVTSYIAPNINSTQRTYRNNDWSVGLFARHTYYIGSMFFVYSQIDASYLAGANHRDVAIGATTAGPIYADTKQEFRGFGLGWTPAVGIFVHDGMALNFSIGGLSYSSTSTGYDAGEKLVTTNSFNFTWGRQFNFGVSKNMGCGHHMHHRRHHGGHMEPGMELRKSKKHSKDEDEDDE